MSIFSLFHKSYELQSIDMTTAKKCNHLLNDFGLMGSLFDITWHYESTINSLRGSS